MNLPQCHCLIVYNRQLSTSDFNIFYSYSIVCTMFHFVMTILIPTLFLQKRFKSRLE